MNTHKTSANTGFSVDLDPARDLRARRDSEAALAAALDVAPHNRFALEMEGILDTVPDALLTPRQREVLWSIARGGF